MRIRPRHRRAPDVVEPERPDVRTLALDEIDAQISRLFALVAEGLSAATAAFLAGDLVAAGKVVRAEAAIDDLHHGIEELLGQQLRSVSDGIDPDGLARLVLALRIVPELERSGDLVEHIAARSSALIISRLPDEVRGIIAEMSRVAIQLWRHAAGTFGGVDDSSVAELRLLDDVLDDLHVQLCGALAPLELPVAVAIEMGLVARFYERLGDHAVNVARRVNAEAHRSLELQVS
jgi:phosphate transport system protein